MDCGKTSPAMLGEVEVVDGGGKTTSAAADEGGRKKLNYDKVDNINSKIRSLIKMIYTEDVIRMKHKIYK